MLTAESPSFAPAWVWTKDEPLGESFAQVQVLIVKKWSPERTFGFEEGGEVDLWYVADIFLHVNDLVSLGRVRWVV